MSGADVAEDVQLCTRGSHWALPTWDHDVLLHARRYEGTSLLVFESH